FSQAVVEIAPEPLVALDAELRIKVANTAFARLFRSTPEAAQGGRLFDLARDQPAVEKLRMTLQGILPTSSGLTEDVITFDLPEAGPTRLSVSARQIGSGLRAYPLILLSLRPVG